RDWNKGQKGQSPSGSYSFLQKRREKLSHSIKIKGGLDKSSPYKKK
ncbi:unnamed protein product, partial [marine sediment metagenome]